MPAANIIVSGYSKGRFMTMVAAASLGNPDIKFSVMAACSPEEHTVTQDLQEVHQKGAKNVVGNFRVA